MAKNGPVWSRYQVEYRPSHILTKVVIITAIALSTVSLVALRLTQWEAQEKLERLQAEAARLEQENSQYAQRIEKLGTEESIRQIAAEELDLVCPGTIVFDETD